MHGFHSSGQSASVGTPVVCSPSQECAREIMANRFYGIADVSTHYKVAYDAKQLQQLAEVPFSEATLREHKDTHALVAGYPMSILDIFDKHRRVFYNLREDWRLSRPFATDERVALRWYLIRFESVPRSGAKRYRQQVSLLSKMEEVPRACEVTYLVILHYLITGERLFENIFVRCCDKNTDGHRVCVGRFNSDEAHDRHGLNEYLHGGLNISTCLDSERGRGFGLASIWKPRSLSS